MGEEYILQFLQYGAPVERIASLSASVAAPFLPSLALSAADSPALIPHLLASLHSHREVPKVLAYAGLDYVEIAQSVLQAEAGASAASDVNTGRVTSEEVEQEDEVGEESLESHWKWENEDDIHVADECSAFEEADEKERVKLAILSVRRRAREFSVRAFGSGVLLEKEVSQYEETEVGSMWSNEAYLPELLCLLPVAVSRCPTLLAPEVLVKGLLSASSGCALLVTTFANNPAVVERGARALARILSESDGHENHSGSPHASESTSAVKAGGGSGTLSREQIGAQSHEFAPPLTFPYAQVMTSVLVTLCRMAPSFAAICREALVSTCTNAEMALHITLEIFHDELQFLSRLIFPKERTSRWILSFLGANQKHGDSQPVLVPLRSLSAEEEGTAIDNKGAPLTQSTAKGVATRVRDALLADARSTWKEQGWCGKLHAHLRLYCVLIRAGDLQPTPEEVDFWIRLLGGTADNSWGESRLSVKPWFVSERTLQLGICFVCLVPGLSSPSTKTLLHACIANLLRAATRNAPHAVCTHEIELAVWVAVQLLLRRFADIAGLVREALGMHVTVHTAAMRDLADAAVVAGVLSDPFIAASAAAALRPSGPVPSRKKRQSLGLKCLEQLLNTSTFARCGVDISDTVMHYICIAGEPIHPALPPIVQGFTELSVTAPRIRGGLPRFRMRPFSRASLVRAMAPGFAVLRNSLSNKKSSQMDRLTGSMKLLSSKNAQDLYKKDAMEKYGNGDPLATAALATYYMLCREQIVRNMGIPGGSNNDAANSLDGGDDSWWMDLLGSLPLRELLMYMETNWPAYEHLLPQWLCVASVVFPERFTAQALLQDLEKTNTSFQTHVEGVPVTEDLDWVGPPNATFVRESEAEVVVPVSSTKGSTGVVSRGIQPEVVGAVDSMTRIGVGPESNWTAPMDIDKEEQDVTLGKPGEEGMQKAEIQSSLMDVEDGKSINLFSLEIVTAVMRKALENPLPALRILNAMMTSTHVATGCDVQNGETLAEFGVDWHLEAAMMRALVPNLLDSSCPRCLQDQFCSWWRTLPSSTLEYLVPVLWDLIKDPSIPAIVGDSFRLTGGPNKQSVKSARPKAVTLLSSGLAQEPLKLLACDVKVFRSPLLGIILDLLMELLVANRRICQVAASEGGRDSGIKREEVAAAMVAQDSAVCQILLEACLPKDELDDEGRPGPLLEARSCICATICSMLYRSPLLLKLLHFQGYDIRLIPMMVEGVPVMVQCLEFIGELLQQSQQQRQVFAAALTAHLTSVHSDLPQSLTAAQQVVGQVTQMRTKVAGCASYLQEVLGAVAQIASTFPSLAPQVVALLQSCAQAGGPLTRSGPPRDAALHAAAVAAFKYLIQGKLLHGRPPPSM